MMVSVGFFISVMVINEAIARNVAIICETFNLEAKKQAMDIFAIMDET